jgi:hypothetical protein
VGTGRPARFAFPPLEAEVARLTPACSGIPHRLTQDDTYEGYFLPKDSIVIANIWCSLHLQMSAPETRLIVQHLGAFCTIPKHTAIRWPSTPHVSSRLTRTHPNVTLPTSALALGGGALSSLSLSPRYLTSLAVSVCPGNVLASSVVFLTCATALTVLDIRKAKDDNGIEIEPTVDYSSGMIRFASLLISAPSKDANCRHFSHPAEFKCAITPRSATAASLVREEL